MSIRIGDSSLLDSLPQTVEIDDKPFILSQTKDGDPVLFDAVCPHQGGTVGINGEECLRCPDHGWEFDPDTGDSTTAPNESLDAYSVERRDSYLFADVPEMDLSIEFTVDDHPAPRPTVSLLSHASLRIDYDGFTLVTDPWLDGPAFLGGWIPYPQPTCDHDELAAAADAIWITHEHSDHLNPRTLSHFPSETPIYVPELNYRRLATRLHDLGFEHVYSLPTEVPYELAEGVEAVCFESQSTWNDSILALNCGGFCILNFNDAGLNWRVSEAIQSADLIATSFAFGASGYPLTWTHLTDRKKYELMDARNEGALQHCEQAVEMFDAEYLLPFAKFFGLLRPEFEEYRSKIRMNTPRDVVDFLSGHDVRVLDLLPGESWDGETDWRTRRTDRDRLYDDTHKESVIRRLYESHEPIVDDEFDLSHAELSAYFEALGGSTLAAEIDDHALTLTLRAEGTAHHALVRFRNGEVRYEATEEPTDFDEVDADTHVKMAVDASLVQHVVRNDLSWDEIHIGYWAEFARQPDEYNLPFWRLLHAPWEARENDTKVAERYDIETELAGTTVADLVEEYDIEEVLANYGMFCAGCPTGLGEDVLEAARIHGLDERRARSLVERVESEISDARTTRRMTFD
jgi:CMP-N-acetylneuraminate monooxygenase